MATILRCDGCGCTTERPEKWFEVSYCQGAARQGTYDVCDECFEVATAAVKRRPPVLTNEQMGLLRQIWDNARNFDQSIGDVEPWHGKAGDTQS